MLIPKTVFSLADIACKEKARYQLCGIHFSRNGACRAMATNGKVASIATWPDKQDEYPAIPNVDMVAGSSMAESVTIPIEACQQIAKAIPKFPQKPILESAFLEEIGRTRNLATTNLEQHTVINALPAGLFPDLSFVAKAHDEADSHVTFSISPEVLIDFVKVWMATQSGKKADMTMTISLPLTGGQVKTCIKAESVRDGVTFTHYAMPAREKKS